MTSLNIVIEAGKATTHKEVSMGELRERMQHDLVVRGMSLRTQEAYLAAVAGLAEHYHRRPDALDVPQVGGYIRHLVEQRHLATKSARDRVLGVRPLSST